MVEENNKSENLSASDAPAQEAAAEIPAQAPAEQTVSQETQPEQEPLTFSELSVQKKKRPFGKIILCIGILLAVAAGVFFGIRFWGGDKKPAEKQAVNYSLYLKDNALYYLDEDADKPVQVADNIFEDKDESSAGFLYGSITVSEDQKHIYYARYFDTDNDSFSLYRSSLKDLSDEPIKIVDDVDCYKVLPGKKGIVYESTDGSVYWYDMEERTKLASETKYWSVSQNGTVIVFRDENDSMYRLQIGGDGEKTKIDSDVASVEYISSDVQNIVYIKDSALYSKKGEAEKVKIDTDVDYVLHVYSTGEIFYTKKTDSDNTATVTLYDYITEDEGQEARDEEIDDEWTTRENAILKRDARFRIWVRDILRSRKIDVQTQKPLYFYNGTETNKISDNYAGSFSASAKGAPVFMFKSYENVKIKKPSMAELIDTLNAQEKFIESWNDGDTVYWSDFEDYDYFDTFEKMILGSIEDGAENKIVLNGTAQSIEAKRAGAFRLNKDASAVYYMDNVQEDVGTLYRAEIKDGKLATAEQYDTEVYNGELVASEDGSILYYKNYNSEKGTGDLYKDKTLVEYDVADYTMINNGKSLEIFTDLHESNGTRTGTLTRIDGGKKTKIAEDMTMYRCEAWDNGTYLYLCNESSDGKHDLYRWKDGKVTNVDFDVEGFVFFSRS